MGEQYSIPLSRFYNLQNNWNISPRLDTEVNLRSSILMRLLFAPDGEYVLDIFRTAGRTLDLGNQQDRESCIAAVCYIKHSINSECFRILADGLFNRQDQMKKENAEFLFNLCCAEGIGLHLLDLALDLVECSDWCYDVYVVNALVRACGNYGHYYYMAKVYQDLCATKNLDTYLIVVEGLCKAGDSESALSVLIYMRREGFTPNQATFEYVIEAFYKDGSLDKVKDVLQLMEKHDVEQWVDMRIHTIKKLCRDKRYEDAKSLLDQVEPSNTEAADKWSEIKALLSHQR